MARPQIEVSKRENLGRGASFKIRRREGLIPAVLYSPKIKNAIHLKLNPEILLKTLKTAGGLNTLLELTGEKEVDGKVVLIKDLQRNPVNQALLHADLYEVDLAKKVVVKIPVQLVGKPIGVEEGGILQQPSREIEVECPVTDIPKQLELDVSGLKIGDSLHVEDIVLPANVKAIYEENFTIAGVVPPMKEEELAPAAPAAPAEGEAAAAAPAAEGEVAKKEGEGKKEGAPAKKEGAPAKKEASKKEE